MESKTPPPPYSKVAEENGTTLLNHDEEAQAQGKNGERKTSQEVRERGSWGGKADFLMSLIAYAIGLGNVWRFPYLCFKNGGGAFLIPYFICWFLASTPIFFMEISIGQFLGEGGISVWKLCPIFKGVGIANIIIASLCNIYYCVIVCWAMFYVISSFTSSILPWQACWHSWNDANCWDPKENFSLSLLFERGLNLSDADSPVTQFWEKRVLKTSNSIDQTGFIQWELALLLLLVWVLTFLALYKGITNSRKLVYICAITPYILLFILLGRGLSLEGSLTGIEYFLRPNMTKLMFAEYDLFPFLVWRDAGTQIFYSSGIGFGTLVALGSYNKYNHNVYRDGLTLCVINSSTSITAGLVVFSVLGYMAKIAGKTVDQVVKSGVGLAFLVYPEAISTLPIAQLWSVLFFLMIMILGLDSQVCTVEGVVLALTDQFPNTLRKRKELFVGAMCIAGFFLGLPMVCQSGQYWLTLVDSYGASGITLLFVVFFEIVALSWGFGAKRIYQALEDMLGFRPCIFWYICWKFTAPLVCLVLFGITVYGYKPLMYPDKVTPYPAWSMTLGFLMSILSMLMIPIYAGYYLYTSPGKTFMEKLRRGFTPSLPLRFERRNKIEMSNLNNGLDSDLVQKTTSIDKFSYNPRYSDVYDEPQATS